MLWDLAPRLKQSRPSDPALDYCLWPYEPPQPPGPSALRSSALLFHSFAVAGVSDKMLAVCDAIQDRFGLFNTVWGIKHVGGTLSWEFYFYDYHRAERRHGIADFLDATKNYLHCSVPPDDAKPYFMFSVEFDDRHARGEKTIDQVDIYLGNPGSSVSSGICYGLSADACEMRNFYFFFDANEHHDDIRGKVAASIHLPFRQVVMEQIIWPEMEGVQTIVVANKRHNDGLYFSRISADQLLHFMDRLRFPTPLCTFLKENRDAFAHHLFDVGYDYLPDENGEIRYLKGGYYGLL
ncbi:hypothetical protein LP7551_05070 [Roseibium album]|nr:hypothetical protein LP7551_05070 [Roseibium album]